MGEPTKTDIEECQRGTMTYEETLASVRAIAEGISGMKRKQEQLQRELPEVILVAVKAYTYRLLALVEGREELGVKDFLAVCEASTVFSDFLRDARQCFEAAAVGSESPFRQSDEEFRAAVAAGVASELREMQEQFRREWPRNVLLIVKQHVYDLFKLTEGKDALGVKDFLAVYEDWCAFSCLLRAARGYVEVTAGGHESSPSERPVNGSAAVPR
jgi:hypothetical protein